MVLSGQLLQAGAGRKEGLNLSLECLVLQALSYEKLNEFRLFTTQLQSEAGASSHSCWCLQLLTAPWAQSVPGQYLLSLPCLPEISSLLEKILYFLSCLILKVTRICVEHLRLSGEEGRLECGSRGPRYRGCRVPPLLITPPPQPSSSSPRVCPATPPAKMSVQPRHPARYISLLPSCEAAAPIPRWGGGLLGRIFRLGPAGTGRGLGCRALSSPIAYCPRTWTRVVGCGWQT